MKTLTFILAATIGMHTDSIFMMCVCLIIAFLAIKYKK